MQNRGEILLRALTHRQMKQSIKLKAASAQVRVGRRSVTRAEAHRNCNSDRAARLKASTPNLSKVPSQKQVDSLCLADLRDVVLAHNATFILQTIDLLYVPT